MKRISTKKTLLLAYCLCWAASIFGQTITWNADESITVVGDKTFIYKTPYNKDSESYYDFKKVAQLIKVDTKYGLKVDGIANPAPIPPDNQEVSNFPDRDGVTISASIFDYGRNRPIGEFYAAYTTENSSSEYKEGKLTLQNPLTPFNHGRFLGQEKSSSTDARGRSLNTFSDFWNGYIGSSEKEYEEFITYMPTSKPIPKIPKSIYLTDKYTICIKVRVKNARFYKMNIPGVGELTPKELFKDNLNANVDMMREIYNNPKSYNYTFVSAHRGFWNDPGITENTFAAFDRAIEMGADILEIDVRLTKDEIPVACHDEYLYRTFDIQDAFAISHGKTRLTLTIKDITAAEFKTIIPKDRFGTAVPTNHPNTIEEILDRYPNQFIALDIKDENKEEDEITLGQYTKCFLESLKMAEDRNITEHIIIKSMSKMTLEDSKKLLDNYNKMYHSDLDWDHPNKMTFGKFNFSPLMYSIYSDNGNSVWNPDKTLKRFDDPNNPNKRYYDWYDFISRMDANGANTNGINGCEVLFKLNGDPFLLYDLPNMYHAANTRVGLYCFDPDTPTGLLVMNPDGTINIRQYTPSYTARPAGQKPKDGTLEDNRGSIDWVIEKGGVNSIVNDRPDMVIRLLEAYGKRSLVKKTQ